MAAAADPYVALRIANYRHYLVGSFSALLGRQAVTIAITWEVYQWTHSATALGFVGLVNVLPLLALSLPAGVLADRKDRKLILTIGASVYAVLNLGLALLSLYHDRIPNIGPLPAAEAVIRRAALLFERHTDPATLHFDEPALPLLYLLVLGITTCKILIWPSRSSITPLLVPPSALPNAITWGATSFEIATVAGPALGGFLIAFGGFPPVYVLAALLELFYLWQLSLVLYKRAADPVTLPKRQWKDMWVGAAFIWKKKVILGASSLDLFAVLLGGAIALLPIYADQILHVGPIGLGWLRASPSIGAIGMAVWTAHHTPFRRPGVVLLWAVAGFGGAIIVFGVSHWFWLSFAALLLSGAFDNVSVVIRNSLVQLMTPDAVRGRVTSVNQMFVGSSNEIGALRAGLMAAVVGSVAAVIWGGIGTIVVVAVVAKTVPGLGKLPSLTTLKPD